MFFQCSGPSCITGTFVPGEIDDGACSVNSHTLGKCVKCNSHGGTIQGDCPDNYLCNSNGKCVKGSKCTEDDKTPNGGCTELNPLCIDGEECVCNTKDPNQPILCVERSSNMCEDPGKDGSCKCGANASCSDDRPICEVKSNGKAECQKCSKDASGGKPEDGDGTTQGNCEMGKICHATGECEGI